MKNIKIEIPEGYQIDQEKSTFENIVFKEVKPKFQIGDYVKIIDWDYSYPNSTKMAEIMGFELSGQNRNHIIGYVFDCIPHIHGENLLVYGVETATSKVLMDGQGLVALTQEEKEEYFKSFTEGDDWFTVFFEYGISKKWICQGDVFGINLCKQFAINSGHHYAYGPLATIGSVSSIRKSTQEEVDLVKREVPEWFKPDYGIGDFVIATSGTKDQLKYIGIYGGKINNSTEEVKQYFTLGEGTYFTGLDGVFNKIVRKANKEEIRIWLDAASRYYGNKN